MKNGKKNFPASLLTPPPPPACTGNAPVNFITQSADEICLTCSVVNWLIFRLHKSKRAEKSGAAGRICGQMLADLTKKGRTFKKGNYWGTEFFSSADEFFFWTGQKVLERVGNTAQCPHAVQYRVCVLAFGRRVEGKGYVCVQ